MVIKNNSVNDFLKAAEEKFKASGLTVKPEAMQRFDNELAQAAAGKRYEEGDDFNNVDAFTFANEAALVLDNAARNTSKIENPREQLMILSDYLYAKAMKEFGCPNIPMGFGDIAHRSMAGIIARLDSKQNLNHGDSYNEKIYDNQRRKDANVVADSLATEMEAAAKGEATPAQIQKLIAEYQALQTRQNNHNFFWRLFHSDENKARSTLLSNMKSAIETTLGGSKNLMKCRPLAIAEKMYEEKATEDLKVAFTEEAMNRRLGLGEEQKPERDGTQELRDALDKTLKTDLAKDIQAPISETISSPIKENSL